jgi:hypothetical protein
MKMRYWILTICLTLVVLATIPVVYDHLRARYIRETARTLGDLKDEETLITQLGQPHDSFRTSDPFEKFYIYRGPTILASMFNNEWPFFHPSLRKCSWVVKIYVVLPEYETELDEINADLKWGPLQFNRAIRLSRISGDSSSLLPPTTHGGKVPATPG